MQVLEPIGGKILRPKDWFYTEQHRGPTCMWTLSKEDVARGEPYTTGVRIQLFTGIKAGTGKTAKQFVLDHIATRTRQAERVISTRDEYDLGMFTRVGLEVEEGPYRVLYSFFWGKGDLDMAIVSASGTTKELWERYVPTFDAMAAFDLIDGSRLKKS